MPRTRKPPFTWLLDRACYKVLVSPSAPPPAYDTKGNLVSDWSVRLDYSPASDDIVMHWRCGEGAYNQSGTGTETFVVDDLEDAIRSLQLRARILGARRLF